MIDTNDALFSRRTGASNGPINISGANKRAGRKLAHPTDLSKPLTSFEMAGMTFAGTTIVVLQVTISMFITYFYTNVVGIGAAITGTLLLVSKIAEAFSDLGSASLIAKTRNRLGQARPWGLLLSPFIFITVILTFSVPINWGPNAKTIYACATYFFMTTAILAPSGIAGSILGTNMTSDSKSRQKYALIQALFTMIGCVVGNVAVLRITQSMGDGYGAWRFVAVLFGALAFSGQIAQFLLTRERLDGDRALEPVGGGDGSVQNKRNKLRISRFSAVMRNKYCVVMCFVGLLTAIDGASAGCIVYYVKYLLHNMDLAGAAGAVSLISMVAGAALAPVIAKKAPIKNMILAGMAVKIVTLIINYLYPYNLLLFFSLTAIRSLTGAPLMVYSSVLLLNTIEYGEQLTGVRSNQSIVSASSFMSKIGAGLGGAMIGWLLSYGGYEAVKTIQGPGVLNTITAIYYLMPMAAAVLSSVLISMYKLDTNNAQ